VARSHPLVLMLMAAMPAAVLAQQSPAPPPAGPATAAPAAKAAGGGAGAVPTADEQVELKAKTLEERVNDLKERIFRTKARLMNLQEMVIGGDVSAGARAVLVHRNEMGAPFILESVAYTFDGAAIYAKTDVEGDLDKRDEFEIFNGRVVPGNHQLTVRLVYRGHGFGVFSYLDGYKFRVQSSYTFNAEPGRTTAVKVVGYEKGGMTTDLKDRPAVRYDVDVRKEDASRRIPQTPAGGTAAPPGGPPPAEGAGR